MSLEGVVEHDSVSLLIEKSGEISGKKRSCVSFITPLIVLVLIGYGEFVYFYGVVFGRWGDSLAGSFCFSFVMIIFLSLTLISFYRAIFTDAGTPPSPGIGVLHFLPPLLLFSKTIGFNFLTMQEEN